MLDQAVFAKIGAALDAGEFRLGSSAKDPDDHILYARKHGDLFYDANGSKPGGKVLFARLDNGLDLDSGDFIVI